MGEMAEHRTSVLTTELLDDYERNGFLVINPFAFSLQEIAEVRERLDLLSSDWSNIPRSRRVKGKVTTLPEGGSISEIPGVAVIDPVLRRSALVRKCQAIACELLRVNRTWFHFDYAFYKQVGDKTGVTWHQDAAYSRTRLTSRAVHFWVPLQDATLENGSLAYMPGSHRVGLQDYEKQGQGDGGVRATLGDDSRAVTCPVGVGGLVCHDPMTVHKSGPNLSSDIRRAWVLQFGIGGWVSLRQAVQPIQSLYAQMQLAADRRRVSQSASTPPP